MDTATLTQAVENERFAYMSCFSLSLKPLKN